MWQKRSVLEPGSSVHLAPCGPATTAAAVSGHTSGPSITAARGMWEGGADTGTGEILKFSAFFFFPQKNPAGVEDRFLKKWVKLT